ncbi:MAG: histidine phosphatase family protein [Brachymonas sp.]|nr:histidine phosphatase family protein [Brachymonas sp.]
MSVPPSHPRWYLLRHAQPLVEAGVCYGQWDIAADQAATNDAAHAFARHLCEAQDLRSSSPLLLQCSPLQRCQQLADALLPLLQQHGIQATLQNDTRLAELDFGTWEGQPWSRITPEQWQAWTSDFAHYPPGGGESTMQLLQRVRAAADEALRWLQQNPNGKVVWISHAGVMRALHWLQQHGATPPATAGAWPKEGACGYGQWLEVGADVHLLRTGDA